MPGGYCPSVDLDFFKNGVDQMMFIQLHSMLYDVHLACIKCLFVV